MCEMALQCQMSDADVDADVEEEGDETQPQFACPQVHSVCFVAGVLLPYLFRRNWELAILLSAHVVYRNLVVV